MHNDVLLQVLEITSYVRGYHAYMEDWTPTIGESLLVKPEPTNAKAVAVLKDDLVVGHLKSHASTAYMALQYT